MSKRHKKKIEVMDVSEKNGLINNSSNLSSAKRKYLNISSSSRRFIGSARRSSTSKLTVSLSDFVIDNEEFNCWEYYKSIERSEIDIDECMFTDHSNIENYTKLFNLFYSSIVLGTGNYIDDMVLIWNNFITGSGYCTETNKNETEKVLKIFFGKLFINISLGDIKGYYSAMIYLLISSLPCKPQITTMLRPYIIRKVMGMINESGLKNSDNHSNINSKKISKKKRKKDDSESNDDSDDYESNNKENVFSGLEQIKKNEDIVDLQLKLINCLVLFCRNMDISNNTAKISLEGFNEFFEGLTELLIYNNEYQLKNWSEINNFKTIISRLVDYSSNGNLQLIHSFVENKNFSISRMIVIGILLLFINIGENRYIRHISDYNNIKSKRFRVIKLESVNVEIVLYSTIILFRKLIPLLIIGNEVSTANSLNSGIGGNKNQNSLNLLVFKLIKDVIILFPEIVYPNMILIIRKISEIQYLQGVNNINSENNYYESDKEGNSELLSDSEKTYKYDNEYEIKKKEKLLYGIEVLKELSESIKNSEYYYIDNILSSKLQNNSEISNNELFLNDPFIGFVFSLYLLSSDKSDARQNIIDQIHSVLIPSIIQSSEDKYSTKMLLFDILKQSLFDEDDNSIDNIKGINSFISFLSNYIVDYKLNTIDDENMHAINIKYLPFKYPHLIYRRIISILPFMFHSSKPNYRIIAIDITGHILQLKSSLLLLSNFTDNIKNELNLNSIINKNDVIMEREKKIFNRLFIIMDKMFNNIEYKNDIEMSDNKQINSSRTNSARQSIEWSGITIENKISDNNVNFSQCEMSLQLYNLILFLLERTKDMSPNVRIKSISILSLIITAIYELMNVVVEEDKKSFVSGISAIIDDFVQSNKPVIPIMDIIIELVFDEKAICRKGSLLLWDSFFSYIKSKNINILNKKSYILQIFKKTLTDSSIIVRRHSLQSLYALYCYSPQYKWISNMWINYGLPTIIDTENIIVDKTTEICYNMLLEQIKKLSEYMINYNNNKDNVYEYIMNMKSEYVFSWISLKSNKENQIQTISLYRICIRNIIKKYPLLLQPLVEFLNTLIDFFIKLFNHSTENNLSDKKIEFPDLPFIIMEEIYVYINQNSNIGIQNDNLYLLTENIYKILEICVMNEYDDKKIISSSISLNNLLLITNSLLEIYKLIMSSYNIHINTENNKKSNKLLSSYEKIIYNNNDFYSRLTKMLIDYDEFDKSNNIFLRTVVSSSSLSTILYLIYLWDEVNDKKNSNKELNSWILNNKKLLNNSELKCISPEISEKSKNIELIYVSCINKLSIQINKIRQNVTNNVFLNVRILGELFLLNYTLTNINTNSPNKEKKDIVKIMKIIDSNNIELIIPYIEELYKYYSHIYSNYQNDGNNDISIKNIESIMSVLILALGQGCYSNNNIANNIIKNYLIPDVLDNNAPLSIRNNIVILLHDLYILHTTLVDPHLSNLFSLIIKDRKENNSEDKTLILRKQAIILLSDLIGQGYIKLRGAYFLKLLNSLVDRNNNIRNIAHGIFERILLRTNTSILVQNFVETMCYLNNWIDHPCIKALNINDKMLIMKNSKVIIQGFNEDEKKYIFKFIFNHLSDKQKNEIIIRIVHDFLALFIDQSNILKLPDSYDKNDGKTLKDALYLLYSPELCIYHKYSKKSYNKISTKINSNNVLGDENELILQESAIEPSELNNKNCTNILLKELIQASLAIDIIPTLLSLKHLMKQSCSPFIKDIHKCIGELLKDYKNNLSSIIQDNTLIKELEYDFRMGLI